MLFRSLVIIGVLAIVITLFLPRGIWGLISGNGKIRLFPVGYRLINPLERFSLTGGSEPHNVTPHHE